MSSKDTNTLILLHKAVFLAGWTGIFGRLISLGGLPLVWYRIMVSIAVLTIVLAFMGRLHKVVLFLLFSKILVINVPLRVLREPSSEDTLLL